MYHYINGIGKVWVGTDQPPRDEFEINSLWLHPTDTKDPLWELLAFDCREGHEEWVRVGGAGGGGSDPGNFTAIVENVVSTASADANVVLDGNTFKFSFDLPKGDKGEPGQPGAPGSDGAQGIPGEDGEGVEYIFTRTETSDPTGVPPVPVDPPYDNPPAPWTDDPTGVDNVYRYEWVSKRIKVHNVWSVFSEPSIWARYSYDGADGKDGKDIEFIFARKQSEVAPATPPTKQVDDYVPTPEETSDNQTWTDDATGVDSIWRYEYVSERTKVNDVWGEFSKPAMWARYSLDGRPGTPPNYMIFAFYKGNTQPSIPTSESLPPFTDNGNQWVAAPDSTGKWWMAAGNVEWVDDSEKVTFWSIPVQATGEDGVASDYYNFKYAVNSTPYKAPDLNKSSADPGSSWTDEVPANPKGTYLWMIIGRFSQGELQGTWSDPIRLTGQDGSNGSSGTDGLTARILYQKTSSPSQVPALNPSDPNPGSLWASVAPEWTEGEAVWMITAMLTSGGDLSGTWQGPFLMTGSPGPAGPSGVSGVPGVSYEFRYCLGTATVPTGTQTPGKDRDPAGWTTAVPTSTSGDNIYIWFIQARIRDCNPNIGGSGDLEGSWSVPARLQGINGLDGMPGSPGAKGQIVYPAGVYSADTIYTTTSEKAPYVFDTGDSNYYVLNTIMSWDASQQVKKTPHEDVGEGGTHSWILMESFDAIYANIGVFGTALVGSAVFWDDWVYSQRGIDNQGDPSSDFERFSPSAPMGPDALFTPNMAFNFKTGDGFLAAGKIRFYAEGKVVCNNIEITDSLIQEYVNYDISSSNQSITVTDLYAQISGSNTTNFVGKVTLNYPATKFKFSPGVRYSGAVINNSGYDIKVIYNAHDSMNTNLYYERTTLSCKAAATDTNGYASDKRVSYVLLSPGATMEYSYIPNTNRVGYWSGVVSIKNASDFRLVVDNWNISNWNAHAEFKGADYEVPNNIIAMAQVNVQPNGRMSFNGLTGKITRGGITLELSQTSDQQAAFQGVFTLSGFNLGQEYYKYMVVATGSVVPKGSSTSNPLSPFIPNVVNKTDNKFEIWMRFGDGSYIVPTRLGSSNFNLIIYDLTEALR